jgi:hypothetical protein
MESIGFTGKKKITANFHVLYRKNEFRAKIFFHLSRGVAVGFWTKFEAQLAQPS